MKSVKNARVFFLVSVFLFTISKYSVSASDPETNFKAETQACANKCRPNHDTRQHAMNSPYFIDPNYTYDIIPKRGDSTGNLRINRAVIEKADEKLYQNQINAEGIYDLKHKENIEAIFQSLAYETDSQMTNRYESAVTKANMEVEEQNNKNNLLNTADKGDIDNTTLMARIADIFGPPPTDYNNLHFKRNIHEKNNQGSLQAAIYSYFGPEVPKSSKSDGTPTYGTLTMCNLLEDSITSLEGDGETADNSGLRDRFPPYETIVNKSAEDHKTSTTTQGTRTEESTPDSRHISRNRPDLNYPNSSGLGKWASSSPKTQEVPIPPPTTSSSMISSSSPSLHSPSILSFVDVEDSPSSTSSPEPTVPWQNGAPAPKANSMLLSYYLPIYCFCLMALVASL